MKSVQLFYLQLRNFFFSLNHKGCVFHASAFLLTILTV